MAVGRPGALMRIEKRRLTRERERATDLGYMSAKPTAALRIH